MKQSQRGLEASFNTRSRRRGCLPFRVPKKRSPPCGGVSGAYRPFVPLWHCQKVKLKYLLFKIVPSARYSRTHSRPVPHPKSVTSSHTSATAPGHEFCTTRSRKLYGQKTNPLSLVIIRPLVFSMHLFPAMSVLTPNSHCAPVMPVIALSAAGH